MGRKINSSKDKAFVPVVRGHINALLKEARVGAAFSQLEASKTLGLDNSQYVSNIERGLCAPSMDTILVLAKKYKIAPNKIVDVMISDYSTVLSQRIISRKNSK